MDYFTKKSVCCVCSTDLSAIYLRKIYRCKRCHQDVCKACSTNRVRLFAEGNDFVRDYSKLQRVCEKCYKDYSYCQQFINSYHLKWNTRSKLYTKFMGSRKPAAQQLADYIPEYEVILKDVETGRSDSDVFNYSLREFLSQCQMGIPKNEIRQSICRVLKLMVAHNPYIGYCQGMNYIAVFLLCIADEEGAYHLMAHLFDCIIPPRFYSSSSGAALIGLQAEQHFLIQTVKGKEDKHAEKLSKFLEIHAPQLLLTLLISSVKASCLLVIWEEMLKHDKFSVIGNAVIFILDQCKDLDLDKNCAIDMIMKKIDYEGLLKLFQEKQVYFSEFERKIIIEQFYAQTSRSWVNDEKLIIYRLKKITNFDQDEVLQIQSEFKKYCLEEQRLSQQEQPSQVQLQQQGDQDDDDEGHLTGSSSDEEGRALQKLQLQQTRQLKYGINKENFQKLMANFHQTYSHQKQEVDKYDRIFDLFDEHRTGRLDFREFLTCLSVILRGTFEQKLKMFFSAHQKQVLTRGEFLDLLTILIEESYQATEDFQSFLKRITKPKLSYLDMLQISQDEFICQLGRTKERRGTCIHIANSLKQITQE